MAAENAADNAAVGGSAGVPGHSAKAAAPRRCAARSASTCRVGSDGKVKATHSGFAGPASGTYHTQLREEFTSNIERLLRERPAESTTTTAAAAAR